MTYRSWLIKKNRQAQRTRAAIAKLYANHPGRAVAHVNVKLDEANRAEYERQPVSLW